jgi:hypothetical protein
MTTIVRAPSNLIVATLDKVDVRLAGVDITKAPSMWTFHPALAAWSCTSAQGAGTRP